MLDYETLRLVWWGLIGLLLIGFAIADGMDMGVGTLLPFLGHTDHERRVIINTVAPHWDGNQVWLIAGAGCIFAAWPAVYAAAFSGFYFAMMAVLTALFLRPVGFDYRSKIDDTRWRGAWDWALFTGSAVPAFLFGVVFGNLLQGVPFHLNSFLKPHYDLGAFSALPALLNPFALLAGLISVMMLTVHGAVWLQLRADKVVAERARGVVSWVAPLVTVLFGLAGLWVFYGIEGYRIVSQPALDALPNPLAKEVVRAPGAWLDIYTTMPLAMLAPIAGLAAPLLVWALSRLRRPGLAILPSALTLTGIISTAGLSMFPFVMPSSSNPGSSLTIWDAASSALTLKVMLVALGIFLPLVLLYTTWCYFTMWRRVTVKEIEENTHQAY